MDRMLVECLIDAKLDRIRTNLKEELEILPSNNPHATAARVAVNAMILALGTELKR